MQGFFDNLYGVLFKPGETFREITRRRLVGQGLIVLILSGLLPVLAHMGQAVSDMSWWMMPGGGPGVPPELRDMLSRLGPVFGVAASMFAIVFRPVKQFLYTALLHFISGFAGGPGPAGGLFAGICYASLPGVFAAPVHILTRLSGINFTTPASIILLVWVAVLQVVAIRENNDFTTSKAVLVFMLPWLVAFGIVLFILVVMAGTVIPFIMPYINRMM